MKNTKKFKFFIIILYIIIIKAQSAGWFSFGNNANGQLGLGNNNYKLSTFKNNNLTFFDEKLITHISTSDNHVLILLKDSSIYSFGLGTVRN
jgi:alpha-tubulin suppressor-like RCC1 family protein